PSASRRACIGQCTEHSGGSERRLHQWAYWLVVHVIAASRHASRHRRFSAVFVSTHVLALLVLVILRLGIFDGNLLVVDGSDFEFDLVADGQIHVGANAPWQDGLFRVAGVVLALVHVLLRRGIVAHAIRIKIV